MVLTVGNPDRPLFSCRVWKGKLSHVSMAQRPQAIVVQLQLRNVDQRFLWSQWEMALDRGGLYCSTRRLVTTRLGRFVFVCESMTRCQMALRSMPIVQHE